VNAGGGQQIVDIWRLKTNLYYEGFAESDAMRKK